MPRIARVVAVGYPHHITQRGNYKQRIFSNDTDRQKYLSFLKEESDQYDLKILAYCLMPNHVHFIVVPGKEDSMAKVFKYAHMKYSQYYNKRMRITGHLFQGRFFSSVMDELYTLICARYIERNPVRAKMVNKSVLWEWSSAKVHCGIAKHDELGVRELFAYVEGEQENWNKFIEISDNSCELKQIREQTRKGRPIGSADFVERLEKKLKRFLRLKPRGRPKKMG
ncbi:MAG: transposase [Candidatus Omnitrophica bacterium]|nr:transposase [Candidatus Omnitrophota bacterium]MDD5440779.1 transposase [Candidatus Omnitrophota bacterium]